MRKRIIQNFYEIHKKIKENDALVLVNVKNTKGTKTKQDSFFLKDGFVLPLETRRKIIDERYGELNWLSYSLE